MYTLEKTEGAFRMGNPETQVTLGQKHRTKSNKTKTHYRNILHLYFEHFQFCVSRKIWMRTIHVNNREHTNGQFRDADKIGHK